jgi:hypothetical protein
MASRETPPAFRFRYDEWHSGMTLAVTRRWNMNPVCRISPTDNVSFSAMT